MEEVRLTFPTLFLEALDDNEGFIENSLDNVSGTTEILARKLSVSSGTIRRELDKMKSLGMVKREGAVVLEGE